MNKKMFAIGLLAVLVVSIGIGFIINFQNQGNQPTDSYIIVGTLNYAPGHAIYPGISATSITPNVSPEPSTRTFTEANGTNKTVASFVFLYFSDKFMFSSNSVDNYPVDFVQGDVVKVSGEMSYDDVYQGYVMNVTNIAHYSS